MMTPHHHEYKVLGGKKGLWHQSDLQVLGKNLRMWRNGQGKGRWGREQGTLRISGHIAPQETSVKKISTNVHSYFIIYRTRGSPALDTVPSASAGRSMEKGSNQN